jgi:succinyl-CoA synthetase alpha subunit
MSPFRVIVQGITGRHGRFHTAAMLDFGTDIVAGVAPKKAGQKVHGVPVFDSIKAAVDAVGQVNASVIFVPAINAKAALIEAIQSGIKLIACITEGIPIHDFLAVKKLADQHSVTIIGPNCPGLMIPGVLNLGIIPASVASPGKIGLVSRSGTLTYEVAHALTRRGLGQRYIVGIGGDPIKGTSFVDWLTVFRDDPLVNKIIMIGEIGGRDEITAGQYIARRFDKPVFAYVAGHFAKTERQFGHAGAIIGHSSETALAKTQKLRELGIKTADSVAELVENVLTS